MEYQNCLSPLYLEVGEGLGVREKLIPAPESK
jgi:hypothetical protein